VLVFKSLDTDAIRNCSPALSRSRASRYRSDAQARTALERMADGDGRASLTLAEEIWRAARKNENFDSAKLQEMCSGARRSTTRRRTALQSDQPLHITPRPAAWTAGNGAAAHGHRSYRR